MQDDGVLRPDLPEQLGGAGLEGRFVDGSLGVRNLKGAVCTSMQHGVEALGEPEELGLAADHNPPRVDARAQRIRDEGVQHLRDAATLCG